MITLQSHGRKQLLFGQFSYGKYIVSRFLHCGQYRSTLISRTPPEQITIWHQMLVKLSSLFIDLAGTASLFITIHVWPNNQHTERLTPYVTSSNISLAIFIIYHVFNSFFFAFYVIFIILTHSPVYVTCNNGLSINTLSYE